ncbi:hydroxymethylpyrimidine/phosphomethylpyrimidine kinase [Chitinophaga silvatica]|uniref:hydroxymethylpyrimidine kinase n=1 Tax=Chitinophaga silvatica TaxID=2282649 RepID=A0A3E1YBY2_9BACT|nr:hydroxymethylpyrimidine/phosphomethylpyrimidine kinase [Chitinophaga silvatica]RFS23510.1 hydroxymethylpyrimidine/phosphomethylpyrimidine kinase [Chitinophaga silvatica]
MEAIRPKAMSIGGLDPSGGAGLLADIKTFEQHKVIGYGCCSAITAQTSAEVFSVSWLSNNEILTQVRPLLEEDLQYCKIGIMPGAKATLELIEDLKMLQPGIRIILDPVLKASAGFNFHASQEFSVWKEILSLLYLITPNAIEAQQLTGINNAEGAALELSASCSVLLKGGHRTQQLGYDILYTQNNIHQFSPGPENVYPKHGSGCVLSAAITSCLAKGMTLTESCSNGKRYTEKLLASHSSLIGYHHI